MAEELKVKGNSAFQAGKNDEAVEWFTKAIEIDGNNHILFSNRSAAYCAAGKYSKALEDAIKTTELKPDWAKGWSRKGAALHGKGDFEGAISAYQKGLDLEPANDACKKGIQDANAAKAQASNPFAKIFGPDVWMKIQLNPKLAPYLEQPDYVNMIKMLQTNPQSVNMFLQDKRIMQTFAVLSGLNFDMADAEEDQAPPPKHAPKKEEEPKKPLSPEEQSHTELVAKADAKKEEGNKFYKSKEFDKALEMYDAALEILPSQTIYRINKAAVYFEKGEYETCIKQCEEALEKAQEHHSGGQVVAKALARKGSALHKLSKLEEAITAFKSSLLEHRTADTLTKLQAVEKEKKQRDVQAYLDPQKAQEAKERGNELFKVNKYPEAIHEYDEAIRRKPDDHTYYSNRAACYMKMGEYSHAMKDCDKALELSPTFVKAMTRKGHCHFWMKEYHKALQWYQQALESEPNNEELRSGVERTLQQINNAQGSGEMDEERVRKAMADPEIQALMQDPVLHAVLRDFNENPAAAQKHLQDPGMRAKIEKLIAAGVIRTSTRAA
eukprot:GGOE01001295.1.p1 GENE.GGOE01001295.1~~GGOE01001295.1.p1  ORF type:complete len:569 (+),score=156.11 GGOE01001295.1:49-1707(+)